MLRAASSCSAKCYRKIPIRSGANVRLWGSSTCQTYATLSSLGDVPKPGEKLHGFTLQGKKHVPELQLTALRFEHDQTGADYLHLAREDRNNVFSIGFKTNPPDATGVPHILEHTTLCGSQRYPVRDPFFKMLRRSLSNFMNAFTSADHTSYPFATTNYQDFENLLSVYIDATLHPLLNQQDFLQEGWRIGPEDPVLSSATGSGIADLVFKGVVYNEMKGQMSDSSYLYYTRFQDHIFPAINNSGGDPHKMTELTYDALKSFHRDHYHPSNAKIFTYGDFSVADHTRNLNDRLSQFHRRKVDRTIKEPISLEHGPMSFAVKGPTDTMLDPSQQFKTSTSWLTGDTSDMVENFALNILSSLLLGGYGSPLYQALIESGLGLDFSPNTGYDGTQRRGIFSIGVVGASQESVPIVKQRTQETLRRLSAEGFDQAKIDGILHQLELSLKHKTANFGMAMMQRVESSWFNGVNPFEVIAWDAMVDGFRKKNTDGTYLQHLVEKYLVNDQTLTFTMEPYSLFAEDLASDEQSRLKDKISEMVEVTGSEEQAVKTFQSNEMRLLREQSSAPDQDLSSLPTLRINDIPRNSEIKPVRLSNLGSVDVQWREAATNGLTYFRGIHRLDDLPRNLRMLLPLFTDAIMRLGTKTKSMEELEDLIKLSSGGINVGYHCSASVHDLSSVQEGISFSSYALNDKVPAMFELLRMLLQETDFSAPSARSNILQLIQAEASSAADAISNAGHSYASRYASASLTPLGVRSEQTGGLTQIQHILELSTSKSDADLDVIIKQLQEIQQFVISNSASFRAAITCDQEAATNNEQSLRRFLHSLPTQVKMPIQKASVTRTYEPSTFVSLPFQVSHAAASIRTVPYIDPAGAPLQILSELLTHRHLHHEIREKGGAYGGGAAARALGGTFGFYSYRDPNPENTLKVIREAGDFATHKAWTKQDLDEAKLSTFQSVDAPQSVSEDGMARFLSGVDEEMEQERRQRLLDVTISDVKSVAQRFLVDGAKNFRVAILGKQQDWIKPSDGWHIENMKLGSTDQNDM